MLDLPLTLTRNRTLTLILTLTQIPELAGLSPGVTQCVHATVHPVPQVQRTEARMDI